MARLGIEHHDAGRQVGQARAPGRPARFPVRAIGPPLFSRRIRQLPRHLVERTGQHVQLVVAAKFAHRSIVAFGHGPGCRPASSISGAVIEPASITPEGDRREHRQQQRSMSGSIDTSSAVRRGDSGQLLVFAVARLQGLGRLGGHVRCEPTGSAAGKLGSSKRIEPASGLRQPRAR